MADIPAPQNPSNKPGVEKARERKRIPMNNTVRRLETPEIPGYHLHWFLDKNVERALQAGYEMVNRTELSLNQVNVATSKSISGNADLGSGVKIVGGVGEGNTTEYLNLMKIPLAWWQEDQKEIESRNAQVLSAIFKDEKILGSDRQSADDRGTGYVKQALFQRPKRKA